MAWVFPAAVFALTGAWLVSWLWRTRQRRPEPVEIAPAVSRELIGRLDNELLDLN